MTNTYRIGTELIDTRDGRPCVVSAVDEDGRVTYVRKRALGSKRWRTHWWEHGRYLRPKRAERLRRERREALYLENGPEVVLLAEALGLPYHAVAKELNHV